MKTSEKVDQIAAALVKAQTAIKGAEKDGKGNYGKYSTLGSVVEACKGALVENSISFVQTFEPSEKGELRLSTTLIHASGQFISGECTMPLARNDPQAYGSAATYARRYSLAAMVGVCPDDDDGNGAGREKPRQQTPTRAMPVPPNVNPKTGEVASGFHQDAAAMENAIIERGGTDPMDDAAKFEAILHEAFDAANFHATDRGAVIASACKTAKVSRVTDLKPERRSALVKAIMDGKFDSLKKHKPAAA
jgi:hypothetical protein